MKRSKPLRRKTPMRRKRAKPRRGRDRDPEYMAKVRRLPCIVRVVQEMSDDERERLPFRFTKVTLCSGRMQADHMGERGYGTKSHDRETGPACKSHHGERTDGCGVRGCFKGWSKSEMRTFCDWAITRTQHEVKEMG